MNKTFNGDDFELLYEAYVNPNKDEVVNEREDYDDEDGEVPGEQDTGPDEYDEDEETVEEESDCDKDDEGEDDDDTVEEGFFDRAKATASSMKGAAKDVASNVGTAARNVGKTFTGANKSGFEKGKDVKANYTDRKTQRIIESHAKKLKTTLSDFASDLVKMEITDEQTAEGIAQNAYQAFLSEPQIQKYTKARAIKR